MTQKRKLSYEQDMALDRGRKVARGNQRVRMAAKDADAKAQAERDRAAAEHVHSFSPGEYVLDYTHTVHECRCGFAEMRKVRPL